MTEENVLESVLEHHTDMLMVEELRCDAKFSYWFALRCGIAHAPVSFVRNSVWDSTRESDVLVQFGDTSGHAVLIENKVTAPLSLNQAEDYHRRGAALVSEGRCSSYRTCILAPATWFIVYPEHGFHVGVTYEDVAEAIACGGNVRAQWRSNVFHQGARRATRKLTFSNEQTAVFLRSYYAFGIEHHPELGTKRSTGLKSTIVVYPLKLDKELGLGRYLDVQHNILEQRMKIAIGWSDKPSVESILADLASANGWLIVQNGQRVDIVAEVPRIAVDVPIADQESELEKAMTVARQMVDFVRLHADLFRKIPMTNAVIEAL